MEYAKRRALNDKSRNTAEAHNERWSDQEVAFLEENWSVDWKDLEALAELLGRTVEACRQKHYDLGVAREHVAKTKKTVRPVKSYTSLEAMGY